MTLKHCQPRQIEASTAVEKTCKHTKTQFFFGQISSKHQHSGPRIIIISSTDGDKSATTNQHCKFSLRHLKRIWFLTTFDSNKRIENKCCYLQFFFNHSLLSKNYFIFLLGKIHLPKYFGWVRTFNTPVKSSH